MKKFSELKKLFETTHSLDSPVLTGTDEDKIDSLQIWADGVGLLRRIKLLVSWDNKRALLDAIRAELDKVDAEFQNLSADVNSSGDAIPSMDQPEAPDIVDLSKSEESLLNKIKKNAGINPNVVIPYTNRIEKPVVPEKLLAFSAEAISKMKKNAGL